jgi:hypothetical protein
MAAGSSRCGGVLLVAAKAGGDDPVSETGIASNTAALPSRVLTFFNMWKYAPKTIFHSSISTDTQLKAIYIYCFACYSRNFLA